MVAVYDVKSPVCDTRRPTITYFFTLNISLVLPSVVLLWYPDFFMEVDFFSFLVINASYQKTRVLSAFGS